MQLGADDTPTFYAARAMRVHLDGLQEFETTIKTILDELNPPGSVTGLDRPATEDVHEQAYGKDFLEAQLVQGATDRISQHIRDLAVKLHLQIEAMRLTIRMSADKAAAADQDNKDAMSKVLGEYESKYPTKPGTPPMGQTTAGQPPAAAPAPGMD